MTEKVPVRSQAGIVTGDVELAPALFDAQVNVPAMHQVVVAQMAAWRRGTHSTKSRGNVRGGGRKPYRQKGTGRARQGSIRSPQWTGGGVAFGPTPRSHRKKVNKKMRALALRSALTDRARAGKVAVVESLAFDTPKTKEAVALLNEVGLGEGKVLLVLDTHDEKVERSFRNLQRIHTVTVDQLNVYDILARDWVLFTKTALDRLQERAESIAPPKKAVATTVPEGGAGA